MKKIYAFDFDGTIVTNAYPDIGAPYSIHYQSSQNMQG